MKNPSRRGAIALLIILLLFAPIGAGYGSEAAAPSGLSAEEREIHAAARKYLDAEVARDLKTVYGTLAPSSIYCTTHDYEAYLAEAGASPVRIREYKILRVKHIRINEDKQRFPQVEKFAEVEVDMKVFFTDTNQATEVNHNFTFIKEGGRWYKG
jgi:hypothetical protein